jgi:pyruvate/2-oxoglutarate dehydrogenase complex dihydrolipoamide acyltransferase (E2) component
MALIDVLLPQWGMAMEEGAVVQWLYKVGDHVESGESLVEVEAEKVSGAVVAPVTGTLREIVAPVGSTVHVQGLLARIEE